MKPDSDTRKTSELPPLLVEQSDEALVRHWKSGNEDAADPPSSDEAPFSSSVLPQIDYRHFVLGKLIGSGGFGKLYRASMQSDGSMYQTLAMALRKLPSERQLV